MKKLFLFHHSSFCIHHFFHLSAELDDAVLGPEAIFLAVRVGGDEADVSAVWRREQDDEGIVCQTRIAERSEGDKRIVLRVDDERGAAYIWDAGQSTGARIVVVHVAEAAGRRGEARVELAYGAHRMQVAHVITIRIELVGDAYATTQAAH